MSWRDGRFDMVGYPKRCLVVASTMVMAEVNFCQETLLKNVNLR